MDLNNQKMTNHPPFTDLHQGVKRELLFGYMAIGNEELVYECFNQPHTRMVTARIK